MIDLRHGDCLELMTDIPDESIDSIICDLPYGTTACKWDTIIPFEPLWSHYKRIIKKNGTIVLFGSQPFTSALIMSNIKWFKYEWIWKKSNGGGFLLANKAPLKRHENILIFGQKQSTYNPQKTKGKPYTARSSSGGGHLGEDQSKKVAGWITENNGDRFPISHLDIKNETGLHPTQKPVALLEYMIKTYTNEGETILDNCMGSGSTGVACVNTGRKFIGIEKDEKFFEIAKNRIMEHASTSS
ncbi:MAG: site-specific DNA-methyltransferase [Candidatus Omnitrophota bacterium]